MMNSIRTSFQQCTGGWFTVLVGYLFNLTKNVATVAAISNKVCINTLTDANDADFGINSV